MTLALPGFYCKNKGHQSSYAPFLAVNDGICDYDVCCDGSDEFDRVGGVSCPDKCKEIGKEWRTKDEQRQKAMGTALKKKKELVAEAARLRKEVEDMIADMEVKLKGYEIKAADSERDLQEVERRERGRVVKGPGKGDKATVLARLAKERVEELRESLLAVRTQRDAEKERLKELESILAKFKEEYNPNFNDEGVKRAVRSWEDYIAQEKPADDTALERDLDEICKPDSESEGINWIEWEKTGEDESDVALRKGFPLAYYSRFSILADKLLVYSFEAYLPPSLRSWVDDKLHELRNFLIDNGVLAPSTSSSSGESQAVTNARTALQVAKDELTATQNSLASHKEDFQKDYGQDDIFRALKEKCISKDSGEYTYELCWLGRTTQKSKKGGSDTSLGNFARMGTETVDEEVPADGRGLGNGERITLLYEGGQGCWNGPARSTVVVLGCAEKEEIWKVVEAEKCVYRMEVGTVAVCGEASGKVKGGVKDEL